MSFTVEHHPKKEDIFKKSDDECSKLAAELRNSGKVYVDPDFPHDQKSLGTIEHPETKEVLTDVEWASPHQLKKVYKKRLGHIGPYCVWKDPQPFHVHQGYFGNCWLLSDLAAVATKKKLLEQLVPRRDYTMETGVVQVRLCIDGKWQVIKFDFHLPHRDGIEIGAAVYNKQCWVGFVEKAFAKHIGSFDGLHGGTCRDTLEHLTGAFTNSYHWDGLTDKCLLWEELNRYFAAGFLLAASTPCLEGEENAEKLKMYKEHKLLEQHGYSILDFTVFNGHRLIKLCNPSCSRWSGKWAMLPNVSLSTFYSYPRLDQLYSANKVFWMSLEDFMKFFMCCSVCEYREGWNEIRFNQTIKLDDGQETQIIRLNIQQRCKLVIDVIKRQEKRVKKNLFLNIHRVTADNECGELIHTAHNFDALLSSGEFSVQPGAYFVIFASFKDYAALNMDWTIWSPSPLDKSQLEFVTCSFSTVVESVHSVFLKNGHVEKHENGKILIYTWFSDQTGFVMVDNLMENQFVRVRGYVHPDNNIEVLEEHAFENIISWPVPPMSRQIVGYYNINLYGQHNVRVNIKYYPCSRFLNWLNWLDYWSNGSDMEEAIWLGE